jgi:CheY-like chemotaxis protein
MTRPLKILYAEDTEIIRNLFVQFVHFFYPDALVFLARDGAEGLELIFQERPDIVFMDLRMPRMDGVEAMRVLKSGESTRDIPIVVVSAHGDAQRVRDEAREVGAAHFIDKPFTPQQLKETIDRYVVQK